MPQSGIRLPSKLNDLAVDVSVGASPSQGSLLYKGASKWNALAPGGANAYLKSDGSGGLSWATLDLSSYTTEEELTTALASYVTSASLTTTLAGYLPLSGGTLTGSVTLPLDGGKLEVRRTGASGGGYITAGISGASPLNILGYGAVGIYSGSNTDISIGPNGTGILYLHGNSGVIKLQSQSQATYVGSSSNDSTQAALLIKPSTTLATNYQGIRLESQSSTTSLFSVNRYGGVTANSNITGVSVTNPAGLTLTATTGGSLAANTYYYVVTALDAEGGETSYTRGSSVVVGGSNNAVTVAWTAVTNAASYRVYRSTSAVGGTWTRYSTSTNSYTDTGSAGTTASPPATASTKGQITSNAGINITSPNGGVLIQSTNITGGYANDPNAVKIGGYFTFTTSGIEGGNGPFLYSYNGIEFKNTNTSSSASYGFYGKYTESQNIRLDPSNSRIYVYDSAGNVKTLIYPGVADGASAIAYDLSTVNSLTTSGAKLFSLKNGSTEKFAVDKDGSVTTSGNFVHLFRPGTTSNGAKLVTSTNDDLLVYKADGTTRTVVNAIGFAGGNPTYPGIDYSASIYAPTIRSFFNTPIEFKAGNSGGIGISGSERIDNYLRTIFYYTGSASNDSTQDALRVQPSTTLAANYRSITAYASSGATTPFFTVRPTSTGTPLTIDCGNVTNQSSITLSSVGAGTSGINVAYNGGGNLTFGNTTGGVPQITATNRGGIIFTVDNQAYATATESFIFKTNSMPDAKHNVVIRGHSTTQTGRVLRIEDSSNAERAYIDRLGTGYFNGVYIGNPASVPYVGIGTHSQAGFRFNSTSNIRMGTDDNGIEVGATLGGGGTGIKIDRLGAGYSYMEFRVSPDPGLIRSRVQHVFDFIGSSSNDSTQSALLIKPSSTVATNYQAIRIEPQGSTTPVFSVNGSGTVIAGASPNIPSWSSLTLGYGTGSPQIAGTATSGEASISAYLVDANARRAKLFIDTSVWGLYASRSGGAIPFVISDSNSEWLRIGTTGNLLVGTSTDPGTPRLTINHATEVRFQMQRNGTNVFQINHDGTTGVIGTNSSAGALGFQSSGVQRWQITTSGHLLAVADNSYDIGASGATRPRNLYVGTKVIAPALQITTGASSGYVLTSDGDGNATWQAASTGGSGSPYSTQQQFTFVGSASNDSTQDAIQIKPSGALSSYQRPLAVYTSSGASSPSTWITKDGYIYGNQELRLGQTGDMYGECYVKILNRTGMAGAQFVNEGLDLSEFGFLTSTAATANFRFEHRSAEVMSGNTTYGEIQLIFPVGGGAAYAARFSDVNSSITGTLKVGANTSADASAILEASSTTKGFLPPRMTTTQRDAIASPAAGLIVFDTDLAKLYCYDGSTWQAAW